MADISIHREHHLGLDRAREMARHWTEHAEREHGLRCELEPGEHEDLVRFHRSGIDGELRVSGTAIAIEAKLGFFASAFKAAIEQQIERGMDTMLAAEAAARAAQPGSAAGAPGETALPPRRTRASRAR